MKTSNNGVDFIKNFEGCRLQSYQDIGGVWTIGYGHIEGVKAGDTVTLDSATQMLATDLVRYEGYVNNLVTVPLNQNQYDALVSFVYNLGGGSLQMSTLLKKLNAGDYQGASEEFKKWCHVGTTMVQGLLNRRNAEAELFLKPCQPTEIAQPVVIPPPIVITPPAPKPVVVTPTPTPVVEAPKPTPVVVKPISLTITTPKGLNLRASASTSSSILAVLPYQTVCTILGQASGFYEVEYAGHKGYVSAQFVSTSTASIAPTPALKPVPKPAPELVYTVKSGDNLTTIAERYHMTLEHLLKLNSQIKNPSLIHVGQQIRVA